MIVLCNDVQPIFKICLTNLFSSSYWLIPYWIFISVRVMYLFCFYIYLSALSPPHNCSPSLAVSQFTSAWYFFKIGVERKSRGPDGSPATQKLTLDSLAKLFPPPKDEVFFSLLFFLIWPGVNFNFSLLYFLTCLLVVAQCRKCLTKDRSSPWALPLYHM